MVMVIAKIVRGLFYLNLRFETVKMHKKILEPREIIAIFLLIHYTGTIYTL